jgi:hypothetical protein
MKSVGCAMLATGAFMPHRPSTLTGTTTAENEKSPSLKLTVVN